MKRTTLILVIVFCSAGLIAFSGNIVNDVHAYMYGKAIPVPCNQKFVDFAFDHKGWIYYATRTMRAGESPEDIKIWYDTNTRQPNFIVSESTCGK